MSYSDGINTIDLIIQSLEETKQQLKSGKLLDRQLYANFYILSLVYNTIYETCGEESLEEFQTEYIHRILDIIKSRIKADAMILTTIKDDGYYLLKGSIQYNGNLIDVFYLNPYFRNIIIIDNRNTDETQEKLDELYEYQQSLLNRIEELEMAKTNPLYYAKDDSFLLAKMTFQKNKYQKIIQEEIKEKQNELFIVKGQIADIETDLDIKDENYATVYLYRDRYIDRLKKCFHFTVIKEETLKKYEKEQENQDTFSIKD